MPKQAKKPKSRKAQRLLVTKLLNSMLRKMSRRALENTVFHVFATLYCDQDGWNANTPWSADTPEEILSVCSMHFPPADYDRIMDSLPDDLED